jgi:outer membrane protein
MRSALFASFFLLRLLSQAHIAGDRGATPPLPSAPEPQEHSQTIAADPTSAEQTPYATPPNSGTSSVAPGASTTLSLKQAEALALRNNPQISVARLTSLAAQQVTREVRSNLWPTAAVTLTGVDSQENSRVTAGGLNNPIIYPRAAAGVAVNQLITDFGRTKNLVESANFSAKAESENAAATKEQILLAVDQAFYSALQAHAVVTVAQQTVNARQSVSDQVQALFSSKLRSKLDLSFANVNLEQAKLLVLDAQNSENASLATLSSILGYSDAQNYQLVEDPTEMAAPPGNADDLIRDALSLRPEILALHFQVEADQKFQTAERDLSLPTIQAQGVVGDTPVRDPILSNWYGAVGVNIGIPVFNGFLYSARSREARLRTQAEKERLADLRNRISRDVRTSWLNANTAYHRLNVTEELFKQASTALDLAQTRYSLGLSSIVELSQAQLQQTQAQIGNAQADFDYRLALAILRYQTTGL